jgi:3-methyladenine DNA glycosylase Tag
MPGAQAVAHDRLRDPTLADYLAVMSRAVFQAGLRWADIDRQWAALYTAFNAFDPHKVARYDDEDVQRIMLTPGILHSDRKIRTTIANAKVMLELDRAHGGFRNYLRSYDSYDALVSDMRHRFSYVGDISAYYFLFRVGEKVPPFDGWIKTVKGDHPRIREMVGANAAQARPRTKAQSAQTRK